MHRADSKCAARSEVFKISKVQPEGSEQQLPLAMQRNESRQDPAIVPALQ